MKIRWWWIVLLVLLLGVGGVFGLRGWREHVRRVADDRNFARARQALAENKPAEALGLFQLANPALSTHPWAEIEIGALTGTGQLSKLVALYEKSPERIKANADASQLVARIFLHTKKRKDFDAIRSAWRGRDADPGWRLLDADALLLDGRRTDARKLLETAKFSGTNEIPRLVRLALLSDLSRPTNAWNLLAQAAEIDPRNAEVRSFRGQLLEQLGKLPLARVEYVAALVASPDALRRDQLAEFYRRQNSYDLALATWRDGLSTNSADFIWLKAAFWSRVVAPVSGGFPPGKAPAGSLAAFADDILQIEPGHFWSPALTNEVTVRRETAAERQELFWLELLEQLRTRRENEAQAKLRFNRFSAASWQPSLEHALTQILGWRRATNQTLNPPMLQAAPPGTNDHTFFQTLETYAREEIRTRKRPQLPADLDALLRGEHAFAAAFLAAGWREAALQLADPAKLPAQSPEWIVYAYGQALRYNRGNRAAIDFLSPRAATPLLQLTVAELQLGENQLKEATAGLNRLATADSDVGYRAAWLLATASLEQKQFAAAQKYVVAQPRLHREVAGQELLARIALAAGQTAEADRLYRSLAKVSIEARAYLARQAFARKDWAAARRYTQELLALMPDQLELRANLEAIDRAEKGQ